MENLVPHFIELIRRAATDLPADMEAALRWAPCQRRPRTRPRKPLWTRSWRMCSSGGIKADLPGHWHADLLHLLSDRLVHLAPEKANSRGDGGSDRPKLSAPNSVDTLTGKNLGNNLGDDFPYFHFEEWEDDYLKVDLMLKGGGCENVGAQYSLPDTPLGADRDLEGVRARHAGRRPAGAGPGLRARHPASRSAATGRELHQDRKGQILRPWDDHPRRQTRRAGERLTAEANSSAFGPMGFGGKTTVLSVNLTRSNAYPPATSSPPPTCTFGPIGGGRWCIGMVR